jgi:hypothetical protein
MSTPLSSEKVDPQRCRYLVWYHKTQSPPGNRIVLPTRALQGTVGDLRSSYHNLVRIKKLREWGERSNSGLLIVDWWERRATTSCLPRAACLFVSIIHQPRRGLQRASSIPTCKAGAREVIVLFRQTSRKETRGNVQVESRLLATATQIAIHPFL